MTKHALSKSTFIRGQQCQKSLYLHYKRPFLRDKLSAEQLAKFRRGTDVGVLARDLFPGGQDMSPKSPSQYQKKREETAAALSDPDINILYEAVFQYDDVLIMLDVLVRDGQFWKAFEVKSSRSISATYIKDAALQFYVIRGCGVQLSDFSLIYINENYVLNDTLELEDLFIQQSVLNEVMAQKEEIREQIHLSKESLQLTKSPDINIGIHCQYPYPCDFIGHCWKNVPAKSVLSLKTFNKTMLFDLYHNGTTEISQFPDELAQTSSQKSELEAFRNSTLTFNGACLKTFFQKTPTSKKYHSLKLIVQQPAVPVIKGSRPYEMLPVAVSVLSHDSNESETILFRQDLSGGAKFLDFVSGLNKRTELLITDDVNILLQCIEGVVFYTKEDPSSELQNLRNKLVGVRQIIEECEVFHPDFSDGWSLADVATVLGGKKQVLKENVFLIKDLLEENEMEKLGQLFQRIVQYAKAIDLSFHYFQETAKNE
jgi:hypothetical protein